MRTGDPRYKVNPPLRRDEDVLAVRQGLADGTIDIVATDHAPHPAEVKTGDWSQAANGMVGLESALRVVHQTMVATGALDWADVARVMSKTPAQIGRLAGHGTPIAAGQPAVERWHTCRRAPMCSARSTSRAMIDSSATAGQPGRPSSAETMPSFI